MVRARPSALQASASSIATRIAWVEFGRRNDALRAGEGDARIEARRLVHGARLDQAELLEMAHQRRHAVIAQAAGVKTGRHEL